jgi:hypothetical protein
MVGLYATDISTLELVSVPELWVQNELGAWLCSEEKLAADVPVGVPTRTCSACVPGDDVPGPSYNVDVPERSDVTRQGDFEVACGSVSQWKTYSLAVEKASSPYWHEPSDFKSGSRSRTRKFCNGRYEFS